MFEEVTQVIGSTAASKLQQHFKGQSIYIPAGDDKVLADRNARIRRMRSRKKNPVSIAALMKMFSLSKRQIWNILAEGAS